jgi:hypothetical protein
MNNILQLLRHPLLSSEQLLAPPSSAEPSSRKDVPVHSLKSKQLFISPQNKFSRRRAAGNKSRSFTRRLTAALVGCPVNNIVFNTGPGGRVACTPSGCRQLPAVPVVLLVAVTQPLLRLLLLLLLLLLVLVLLAFKARDAA